MRLLLRRFNVPTHHGAGLRGLFRFFKARRRERKLEAEIEAKRVGQLRQDAGVDAVETRVDAVEADVAQSVKPSLDSLEAARRAADEERARRLGADRREQERRETERAHGQDH